MRKADPFDTARNAVKAEGTTGVTKYQHSSVILDRNGKIISVGRNHFAGDFVEIDSGSLKKTIHSEIHALSKVNIRRLTGATIINYARTNVASNMARPCENCWTILQKLGFKKVFYTVRSSLDKPLWKEELF